MSNNNTEAERRLWSAADEFRANSELKSSEYATPVLGLIFLRYADHRFTQAEKELAGKGSGRRAIGKEDYQAKGVMYLPPKARFSYLLALPEGENIGKAINEAMKAVEADNEELKGVLPKTYTKIDNLILASLLKNFSQIAVDAQGDKFGKIYEYFLGNFARAEGQRGGEFFTPTTMVQLIVEVIEPHHGRLMDHSCGSGGMYVQSAKFIKAHKHDPSREISIFGQERVEETRNLCLMNLAVHGLSGDIKQGNSYYEDLHESLGKFDFVMANPPFNVDKVDKEKLRDSPRFPFGMPRSDNANYLWIQLFYSSLNDTGRAGFVMANSAADARQSEMEIRKALLQAHAVDVMVAIGPNFFYTVTLPCTLWFFDKGKASLPDSGSPRPASGRGAGGEGHSDFKMIDPACGSGHFLLGTFPRLLDRWQRKEPGTNVRELAQRALNSIHGVDINPFAVAIAKFRLLLVAMKACDIRRLADAPAFHINVACGDSLLHGENRTSTGQRLMDFAEGATDEELYSHAYPGEDLQTVRALLKPGTYHCVVANPPYIVPKDRKLNDWYRKRFTACHRQYSLAVPFMQQIFQLAVHGGFTGQITAQNRAIAWQIKRSIKEPLLISRLHAKGGRLLRPKILTRISNG